MGQEIGFHLYKKADFAESGKLVDAESLETPIVCGRTEATCFWGALFRFSTEKTVVPVFQKELDGFEDEQAKYELADFEDFKTRVVSAVRSEYDSCYEEKRDAYKKIKDSRAEIDELRELQRKCTEDNSYAFDRWEKRIQDLKELIADQEDYVRTYDDEDYNYTHAKHVEELLCSMEKYLKEGEYLVVPYYSF
jgi:hypothetical protein